MNIDKLLYWLDENKSIKLYLYLEKDDKTILITSFDDYATSGDWENPILDLIFNGTLIMSVFLYQIKTFSVKNTSIYLYV